MTLSTQAAGNRVCWFCATTRSDDDLYIGSCLGEMVYGSHTCLSLEITDDNALAGAASHASADCALICANCLSSFSAHCRLSREYKDRQQSNMHETLAEMADYDVGLVATDERKYRPGCWFTPYADVNIERRLRSLTLLSLFARGLRFVGGIPLRTEELSHFIRSFAATPEQPISHGSSADEYAFDAHFTERFVIESPSLLSQLKTVRACIFDISAVRLVESTKAAHEVERIHDRR